MSRRIGTNCANPGSSAANLAFADCFKMSGNFSNGSLTYDVKGWPTSVTGGQVTATQILTDAHAPGGTHSLYGKGSGTFRISNAFTGAGSIDPQGRRVVSVTDSGPGWRVDLTLAADTYFPAVYFEIIASTPDSGPTVNHLRDIQWMLPGHTPDRVFNQAWLAMNAPFDTLRFLDWSVINGGFDNTGARIPTTVTDWTSPGRIGGQQFAFSMRGGNAQQARICEEYQQQAIVEIHRYFGKTVHWWCVVPHAATPDYFDGLANMVAGGATIDGYAIGPLPDGCDVYVEHSNETWTTGWPQTVAMDQDRVGKDADLVTAWTAAHPGKFIGTQEYIAHRKGLAWTQCKAAFDAHAPGVTLQHAVMSQLGVPALGQVNLDHLGYDNLFTGQPNTPIHYFGAAFYFNPATPTGYLQGLDLQPYASQWATGDAAAKAAAIDAFHNNFGKCFQDNQALIAQYVSMAAAHVPPIQSASYEIGEQSNSFVLQDPIKTQMQGYLQACKADPRYEGEASLAVTSWPDGMGPYVWFNDCQNDPNFGWRRRQWPTQPLAQAPAERALLALIAGGDAPATRTNRRWPRGPLMRLRSTTP